MNCQIIYRKEKIRKIFQNVQNYFKMLSAEFLASMLINKFSGPRYCCNNIYLLQVQYSNIKFSSTIFENRAVEHGY